MIENANVEVLIKKMLDRCRYTGKQLGRFLSRTTIKISHLKLKALKTFAVRIHSEIEQGYTIPDWKNHIFMCNNTFKRFWENVHLAKSIQCQH